MISPLHKQRASNKRFSCNAKQGCIWCAVVGRVWPICGRDLCRNDLVCQMPLNKKQKMHLMHNLVAPPVVFCLCQVSLCVASQRVASRLICCICVCLLPACHVNCAVLFRFASAMQCNSVTALCYLPRCWMFCHACASVVLFTGAL